MPGPLAGIKVLDLSSVVLGPLATQIMGDLGADVIKIEGPEGDTTRSTGPGRSDDMAAIFMGFNRNKRSLVLDLKQKPACDALWTLIDDADVFIHSIRPQKIARLGFGHEAVLARNSRIVYAGIHGYRTGGPLEGTPAYDDVIQGASGIAGLFQERDGEPQLVPSVVADKSAALMASSGLIAAYVKRLRTGRGVYMECSMFEGLVSYNLVEHQWGAVFCPPESKSGYTRLLSRNRRPHRTLNGFICLLPYTDQHWDAFWKISGASKMAADPRFSTMPLRASNIDTLYGETGKVIATRTTEEWEKLLTEADIPVGRVNSLKDLKDDPHLKEIGFFRPYEHPTEGKMEIPDTPYRFDRESLPILRHPPQLGEHGKEILSELGMSQQEIQSALRQTTKAHNT